MASRLNPYLTFPGTAREAMAFYAEVFGGTLASNTFGDFGGTGVDADRIMHAQLETPSGFVLMASDTTSEMPTEAISGVAVSLSGDDGDALRGYWDALSAGGTVTMPLAPQAWGDEFGMCTDRFGVPWLVNIAAAPA